MVSMQLTKLKIIAGIIIFAVTFVCGVSLTRFYSSLFLQSVSLCTVTKYHTVYRTLRGNNWVNLKGYLYGGKILTFGDVKLNSCEDSVAEVVVVAEEKMGDDIQNLLSELRQKTNDDQIARVEVELIGTLKERQWHCFSSKYVIEAVPISPTGSLEVVDVSALVKEMQEAR